MTTDRIPFLDLATPHRELRDELRAVFETALDTSQFVGGAMVQTFEQEFAAFSKSPLCIGVNSGTDALRFALMAAGVQLGDTVVTVPNTFIATTEAISQAGARFGLVGVDARTYTMDPAKFRAVLEVDCTRDGKTGRVVGKRTQSPVTAVVPVHLYGQVADMDGILSTKLRDLAKWNDQRRENARRYGELFQNAGGALTIPYEPTWSRPVYHLYVVQVADRDRLQAELAEAGIGSGIHYPVPLHL